MIIYWTRERKLDLDPKEVDRALAKFAISMSWSHAIIYKYYI